MERSIPNHANLLIITVNPSGNNSKDSLSGSSKVVAELTLATEEEVAELELGVALELSDALAAEPERLADLFQRHLVFAGDPEAAPEDGPLAIRGGRRALTFRQRG